MSTSWSSWFLEPASSSQYYEPKVVRLQEDRYKWFMPEPPLPTIPHDIFSRNYNGMTKPKVEPVIEPYVPPKPLPRNHKAFRAVAQGNEKLLTVYFREDPTWVNLKSNDGFTLMQWAAMHRRFHLVPFLLRIGVKDTYAALLEALKGRRKKFADLLIGNIGSVSEDEAIYIAIRCFHMASELKYDDLLLPIYQSVTRDPHYTTCISISIQQYAWYRYSVSVARDINISCILKLLMVYHAPVDEYKFMFSLGANLDGRHINFEDDYKHVIVKDDVDVLQCLVDNGAIFTFKSHEFGSWLHYAVSSNSIESAKFLVDLGLDPDYGRYSDRMSPFLLAVHAIIPNPDMMAVLLTERNMSITPRTLFRSKDKIATVVRTFCTQNRVDLLKRIPLYVLQEIFRTHVDFIGSIIKNQFVEVLKFILHHGIHMTVLHAQEDGRDVDSMIVMWFQYALTAERLDIIDLLLTYIPRVKLVSTIHGIELFVTLINSFPGYMDMFHAHGFDLSCYMWCWSVTNLSPEGQFRWAKFLIFIYRVDVLRDPQYSRLSSALQESSHIGELIEMCEQLQTPFPLQFIVKQQLYFQSLRDQTSALKTSM